MYPEARHEKDPKHVASLKAGRSIQGGILWPCVKWDGTHLFSCLWQTYHWDAHQLRGTQASKNGSYAYASNLQKATSKCVKSIAFLLSTPLVQSHKLGSFGAHSVKSCLNILV